MTASTPWQHADGEPCDECERRQAHAVTLARLINTPKDVL